MVINFEEVDWLFCQFSAFLEPEKTRSLTF